MKIVNQERKGFQVKGPCKHCGSSDAAHTYDDDNPRTHCFSCGKTEFLDDTTTSRIPDKPNTSFGPTISDISDYSSYPMGSRGISKEVVDYFNVKMSVDVDGKPEAHYYPYTKDGKVVAYKKRTLPKEFSIVGKFKDVELFGQQQATRGRKLVITEGEIDVLSVGEAYKTKGTIWSVVGIPSASSVSTVLNHRDWLNSFESIVLMIDQDEAGDKARDYLSKMLKPGKVKIAKLPCKDANETLLEHGPQAIIDAIWNAQEWSPAGIVMGEPIWEQYKARKSIESIRYPECLNGLNEKLGGMRHGEITLFTSGTGSGKSTVIKEIILDLLNKTDDKIGLISLEESVGDTAEKFIQMQLNDNFSVSGGPSDETQREAFDRVFGSQKLVLLDHQGSVGDSSLIDKIEYMCLMGCKFLVLDHITIAVSEGADGLSGNEAVDKVMSDLLKVVKRHNVWLGLISHLRKSQGKSFEEGNLASIDDIKGSGSIKQISFDIIAFARNLVAEDEMDRNTVRFRVLKSRFTGRTGDAGSAIFDPKTTRLTQGEAGFDYVDFS